MLFALGLLLGAPLLVSQGLLILSFINSFKRLSLYFLNQTNAYVTKKKITTTNNYYLNFKNTAYIIPTPYMIMKIIYQLTYRNPQKKKKTRTFIIKFCDSL